MVLLSAQLQQPLQAGCAGWVCSLCRVGRLGVQAAQDLKRRLCAKGAGEKGGLITVKISKEISLSNRRGFLRTSV